MGSTGDSDDNALAKALNGRYETALSHRRTPWKIRESVVLAARDGGRGSTTLAGWNRLAIFHPQKQGQHYFRELATQVALAD